MDPVLKVDNLEKIFSRGGQHQVTVVNRVSFELSPGECLGVVGESGSGKTTMVNLITRLIPATSGRIILDGQDITNLRGKELRKIYKKMQMVFQTPEESFDPRRTLGDGICESLRNAGMSRAEAHREAELLLKECGLSEIFYDRYPHEVSGGQCQRAAIARALAVKPRLLICDEATSALDVTVQQEIIRLLNQLRLVQQKNLSILFICHDLALVQQFCDRVLIMDHGEIVEQGKPDEVIRKPKAAYTRKLIDSALEFTFAELKTEAE